MANIYYGLNVTHWGLTFLHKMKVIDIGSILNYREVGFGSLIMVHRLEPLMHLRVCGIPILGLGSRWTLVIFLCLLVVWSRLCAAGEGDFEGMILFGFTVFDVCFVAHSAFILPHHL